MRQKTFVHTVICVLLLLWAIPSVESLAGQGANAALNAKTINATSKDSIQTQTRFPYRDGVILIAADKAAESGQMVHFSGKVRIAVENLTINGDAAEYNSTTHVLKVTGQVEIAQPGILAAATSCVISLDQLPPKRLTMK